MLHGHQYYYFSYLTNYPTKQQIK